MRPRREEATSTFLGGLDILVNNAGSLIARRKFDGDRRRVLGRGDEAEPRQRALGDAGRACHTWWKPAATRGGASIVNLSSLAGRHGGGPARSPTPRRRAPCSR